MVLLIVGLLFVIGLPVSKTAMSNQRRAATVQTLKNIQSALNNYVIINKRLPCPADGSVATPTGLEGARDGNGDCTGVPINQAVGIVPWVPLGLTPADARDAWYNQITYRVGYGLTRSNALDMTSCDPAGTATTNPAPAGAPNISTGACVSTCSGEFVAANCTSPMNFLLRKGLDVSDGTTKVMDYTNYTGAAYILISHADNGYGAINNAGIYVASAATGVEGTTLENANRNLAALVVTSGAPPTFIDAPFSDANDATKYFDDLIIRPSLLSVITQAQLGPRSH